MSRHAPYIEVPLRTFKTFFNLPFIQTVIARFQLSLLVYDPSQEKIVQWIK